MTDVGTRWPCPVCLGATMAKVAVSGSDTLTLDHCPRCGGIWLEKGEVPRLRGRSPEALWARVDRLADPPTPRCHACHAHVHVDADACPACGHRVQLLCPPCQHPMQRARHGDLTLDVCARCSGVWFDHHELEALWKLELGEALARRRGGAVEDAGVASYLLLDALTYSPHLLFYGAHAAGQVVSAAAHGVAHAPDIVASAGEAIGAAAEGVFEALAGIVAAIFEGL